jgi:hypothetical protein
MGVVQVAVMREAIVRGRDWDSVAKEQLANVFVTGTQPCPSSCSKGFYTQSSD